MQVLCQVLPSALCSFSDVVFKISLHDGHLNPVDRWKIESKEHMQTLEMIGSGRDGSPPWSTLVQCLSSQFLVLLRGDDWVALSQPIRAASETYVRWEWVEWK